VKLAFAIFCAAATPDLGIGCTCPPSREYRECGVEGDDVVFLGRVTALRTAWFHVRDAADLRNLSWSMAPDAELEQLERGRTTEGFTRFRKLILEKLPALRESYRNAILRAKDYQEMDDIFDRAGNEGMTLTFEVLEGFRGVDGKVVEIWSDMSSCDLSIPDGVLGRVGLISAYRDNAGRLRVGGCRRSSQGSEYDSLLYWTLRKRDPSHSSRLEGLVAEGPAGKGIGEVQVRLESKTELRHVQTNGYGHFLIDGLEGGQYAVTVVNEDSEQILGGPLSVTVPPQGCHSQLVPASKPKR